MSLLQVADSSFSPASWISDFGLDNGHWVIPLIVRHWSDAEHAWNIVPQALTRYP